MSEPQVCRLCETSTGDCGSLYSDDLQPLVSCLPVHVFDSDPKCLPPWVCSDCVDNMNMIRDFFIKIISSYNNLTGGDAVKYVKKDMEILLNLKEQVKEELDMLLDDSDVRDMKSLEFKESICDDDDELDVDPAIEEELDLHPEPKVLKIKAKKKEVKEKKVRREEDKGVFFKDGKRTMPHSKACTLRRQRLIDEGKRLPTMKERNLKTNSTHIRLNTFASALTCADCDKQFSKEYLMREHWSNEHKGKIVGYKCVEEEEKCNFRCIEKSDLFKHLKEHMRKMGIWEECEICCRIFAQGKMKIHQIVHQEGSKLQCDKCDKIFKKERTLRKHKLVLHNIVDPTDDKTYFCDICSRYFHAKTPFDVHTRMVHTNERPFKCNRCDSAYSGLHTLNNHIKKKHGTAEKTRYQCDRCEENFATKKTLVTHIAEKHENFFKYHCTQCPAKYNRIEQFRNHEMTHTGETPFHCSTCGKGFRTKKRLQIHELIHASYEEKYRYPCKVCGRPFTQPNNLKTHMRSHHPEAL